MKSKVSSHHSERYSHSIEEKQPSCTFSIQLLFLLRKAKEKIRGKCLQSCQIQHAYESNEGYTIKKILINEEQNYTKFC